MIALFINAEESAISSPLHQVLSFEGGQNNRVDNRIHGGGALKDVSRSSHSQKEGPDNFSFSELL
jgi:hypothetical protein